MDRSIIVLPLFSAIVTSQWIDKSRGGGTSICMHIGYVPRERPPFSALNFRFGAYHLHKFPKNPFRSITILHFLADFAVPETIIFKISLISINPFIASHGRLSPNAKRSAAPRRGLARPLVPEPRIFTLDRELVPEPLPIFHFAAAHRLPTKIWGEYPPPPPPGDQFTNVVTFMDVSSLGTW